MPIYQSSFQRDAHRHVVAKIAAAITDAHGHLSP